MNPFAFAASPLDRCGNHRNDAEFVENLRKSPAARFIQVRGDTVRMKGVNLFLQRPSEAAEMVFLGTDPDGHGWFALQGQAADGDFQPLRGLMLAGNLPADQLSILAQARSLVHWHESHGFCAKCGTKSVMQDQGYRRHCAVCGTEHFPRTDPVVIMVAQRGRNILLGRQSSWPPGMVSALAGFMEPGETIEDAVRREVREEAGIAVGHVAFVANQPWPFPSSLMIGCLCEALDDTINIDAQELEMARWFSLEEVRQMIEGIHPEGFRAPNPYAIAHHLVREAIARG